MTGGLNSRYSPHYVTTSTGYMPLKRIVVFTNDRKRVLDALRQTFSRHGSSWILAPGCECKASRANNVDESTSDWTRWSKRIYIYVRHWCIVWIVFGLQNNMAKCRQSGLERVQGQACGYQSCCLSCINKNVYSIERAFKHLVVIVSWQNVKSCNLHYWGISGQKLI